jgi:sulfide:quinone oxidoreductase
MRVKGVERMFAVGDCVNLDGPKLGHMAVRQASVGAANLAAELEGKSPEATYKHEMRLVIDEGGSQSIYAHKDLSGDETADVRQGRFWNWAKEVQQKYWQSTHS